MRESGAVSSGRSHSAFKAKILQKLHHLSPAKFEEFAGALLRGYGFQRITITGKAGEGVKNEWKERGLKKSIQLTISGCLGPCDLPNVVSISLKEETVWLGTLCRFQDHAVLVEWASVSGRAGRFLPLPEELTEFRFSPFRGGDSIAISELSQRGSGN